jgi:Flp pilus assembly protein TadG
VEEACILVRSGGGGEMSEIVRWRSGLRGLRGGRQRGVTTVEVAMVAPLLIVLLFGIIEFGLMVKDLVGVNQAAREGARAAAVGAIPSEIETRIIESAPTIDTSLLTRQYEYRSYSSSSGWTEWATLGTYVADNGMTENNAEAGDQIRVTLTYPHQLVTGGLFASLADDPESGAITLHTAIVIRRE